MSTNVYINQALTNATYVGTAGTITNLPPFTGISNVQTFSTGGTFAGPTGWQKPAYGTFVRVECIGGGGAGTPLGSGSGQRGGGGGGGFTWALFPLASVTSPQVQVIVGGGGTPASTQGVNSVFGPYGPGSVTGFGGGGGSSGSGSGGGGGGMAGAGANGGPGGSQGGGAPGSNGVIFGGGGGGDGSTPGRPRDGGTSVFGGGGGAGSPVNSGGTSVFGGGGGNYASQGNFPGGGGGIGLTGYNGASGQVRIYTF
jgi:hypothetical protein